MSGQRLDKELVSRGLVSSRTRAAQLISAGQVRVNGAAVTKPSASVSADAQISVQDQDPWVSRAAHKLLGALEAFDDVVVAGRRCLDAGASTGGFTQVLLSAGAAEVTAVDVGHGQLVDSLRQDPRVTDREGLNLRHIAPGDLGEPFSLIVADLSFISLRLVLGPLRDQAAASADLLLMVKPQFEIGRERLSRTGVVTSAQLRQEAVFGVVTEALDLGLEFRGAVRSPLPGQDGNAEFFLHLRAPETPQAEAATPRPRAAEKKSALPSHVSDRLEAVRYAD
ncbi:TlyA family RNA methyltransferase [Nesterenkonia flava]|uniref:TlyA family RNA methyltransferase n=1 Tax=Nesterenkonia flava TaxID=469799 RepID=A0ABU1FUI5_9MICC|nr:TlyA family RNA methyltransferase [Nesterenkonia flava]MDR5712007.1 TlyA family RNA methyltransferase [Nesterenkonia flava]